MSLPSVRTGSGALGVALVVVLIAAVPILAGDAVPADSLAGTWQGTLEAGAARLRVVLHVERGEDGAYAGTLDSIDQGATGLELADIRLEGREVSFALPAARASYRGTLAEDGASIAGTWSQGGMELPLAFERTDAPPTLDRPQEPKGPLPYAAEEVTIASVPGVTLAGTLTIPAGEGPHPAVVLISGSGPQDRDETVFGHRPFLVLADALTRRGVAVLRYDDRGAGKSTGDHASATSEDFARDAEAAFDFVRNHEGIDPKRVGLVGHSEGGLIAPMVAARRADVAFVVLLAGPGVPGAEILVEQSARITLAATGSAELAAKNRAFQREILDYVLSLGETPHDEAVDELTRRLTARLASLSAEERRALGLPEADDSAGERVRAAARAQAEQLLSPWFRFFLAYDPAPALRSLHCPVLAVIGSKDLQVPPDQNLPALAAALAAAPTDDWTVAQLPGLNHLFQPAATGAPGEYGQIEQTIAPAALERIGAWIAVRAE